jgi:hypothetical protein
MSDPGEIAQAGVTGYAALKALGLTERILGPSADAIGLWLRDTPSRLNGIRAVASRSSELMDRRPDGGGSIAPRVAVEVLRQAQWTEETITTEYLSGILASGLGRDATDDRGLPHAMRVGRMSTASLRLHFLLYRYALELSPTQKLKSLEHFANASIHISADELDCQLGRDTDADLPLNSLFNHAAPTLGGEGLIGEYFMTSVHPKLPTLLRYQMTPLGWQFFSYGLGVGYIDSIELDEMFSSVEFHRSLPHVQLLDVTEVPSAAGWQVI